ncbi:GAF domain-containing protein [Streptomyces kanasensis]|uniref:hypothetical protein n=1 Tax=Streptomyces kanasensis TaxID=936756 RepID=UPI003701DB6E
MTARPTSTAGPGPGARAQVVPDTEVEARRIAAVRRHHVPDAPPDGAFDRVAALAARLFDVPVATVTIVDTDRIRCQAAHGLDGVRQVGRDPGLCGSAVLRDECLVIPDTLFDPVVAGNPLVTGERRTGSLRAASLVEDTVALPEAFPDGAGDVVAVLALSVPADATGRAAGPS